MYHIQYDTIMPIKKYDVSLSVKERKQLTKIVKSGNMPARTILRANFLYLTGMLSSKMNSLQKLASRQDHPQSNTSPT